MLLAEMPGASGLSPVSCFLPLPSPLPKLLPPRNRSTPLHQIPTLNHHRNQFRPKRPISATPLSLRRGAIHCAPSRQGARCNFAIPSLFLLGVGPSSVL